MELFERPGTRVSNLIAESEATAAWPRVADPEIHVLKTRDAKVGGLAIHRALPLRERRLVGAWCFLDHFGPHAIDNGPGLRVGPHPHIGLQTVTWLLEGEVLHRDSLGSRRLIRPGQLNLMTAGRGIAHSEETPAEHGPTLHGLQCWIALPDSQRDRDAAFDHHPQLPVVQRDGLHATILAGEALGERSPARVYSPLVGLDLDIRDAGNRRIVMEPGYEYAFLVAAGELQAAGQRMRPGALYYLGTGRERIEIANDGPARAFLFGGRPFGEAVLLWWNFVARTSDEVRGARADWERHSARFGEVRGYAGERLVAPQFDTDLQPG